MKSNILIILGGVFAISMLGRSLTMNAEAETAPPENEKSSSELPNYIPSGMEPPAKEGDVCLTGAVLDSIKEQRLVIETREEELAERERTLEAIERRVEERMAALDESNKQLEDKMALLKRTASEDVTHLANMYETMKPAQASQIFNQMDPVFAAGFLREMASEQAGLILANMQPNKAYEISIIIASKNSDLRPQVQ